MSLDSEVERMKHFESMFLSCYEKIKYNQESFRYDNEFGPLSSISGDNGEILFDEPNKRVRVAGPSPRGASEEAIKIIIEYLNSGWTMPAEMREYLSEKFEKSIEVPSASLDSLFGLRGPKRNTINDRNKLDAVNYIFIRKIINNVIKKKNESPYFNAKSLNAMLRDELGVLFFKKTVSEDELKRLAKKVHLSNLDYICLDVTLQKNIEYVIKYRDYLKGYIERDNKGGRLDAMIFTLNWIEKELEKIPIIKVSL